LLFAHWMLRVSCPVDSGLRKIDPVLALPGRPIIEELDPALSAAAAFEVLKDDRYSYFLDSAMDPDKLGHFSFVGSSPVGVLKTRGREVSYTDERGSVRRQSDPFDALRSILTGFSLERDGNCPAPFIGGGVGYLSYDLGRHIESIPSSAADDLYLPECCLGFYDRGLVFDHQSGKGYAVSTGFPETNENARQDRAHIRLLELKNRLGACGDHRPLATKGPAGVRSDSVQANFTRDRYLGAVERARQYIIDGDIFEVNLSQRFESRMEVPPYQLYQKLKRINPAPFASYLGFDDVQVVGASPERFLRKTGNRVETRPIKGTRRRGKSAEEDSRLGAELLSSAKDHAENMMIVDLERNDLGRVCRYGSVRVSELAILETYPTVFHLTSTIEGELSEGKDCVDLLKATFPGGSITGAPKVRAMEIIEELEPTRRSIYTGSVGYIGFDGEMELNIVIRTFLVKGDRAYFQAGGAVVYDSDPADEYQETLDKAKALFAALGLSAP
jgi:para-aminobenzoate synthetase component I